jgi:hypothetical protein
VSTKQRFKRFFPVVFRAFAAMFALWLACVSPASTVASDDVEMVWRDERGDLLKYAYPGQTLYLDMGLNEKGVLKVKQVERFALQNARSFQLLGSAEEGQGGKSLCAIVRAPGLVFGELAMSGMLTRKRKWEGGQAFAADLLGVPNTTEMVVEYQEELPSLPVLPVPEQGRAGAWTGLVGDWELTLNVQWPDSAMEETMIDQVILRIKGRSERSLVVRERVPELTFAGVRVVEKRTVIRGDKDRAKHQFDWMYRLKVLDDQCRADELKVTVFDPNKRKHVVFYPENTGLLFGGKRRQTSELDADWLESSNQWVYLPLLRNQWGSLLTLGFLTLVALLMRLYQSGCLHQLWARWVQFRRLRRIERFCRDGSIMSLAAFRDLVLCYLRDAQQRGQGVTLTRLADELHEDEPALAEILFELENAVWQNADSNDWQLTAVRSDSFLSGLGRLRQMGGIVLLSLLCVAGCRHAGWVEQRVGQQLQYVRSSWQEGDVTSVCEGLAVIRERMMMEGMANPALMLNEAAACQVSGDPARALVLLTRALLLAPRNEAVRNVTVEICAQMGVPLPTVYQYTWLRPDEYVMLGTALLLLWVVLMRWGRGTMAPTRLRLLRGSALVFALCSVVTGVWLWQTVYRVRDHGVVSQHEVSPVMLPSEAGALYDDWVLKAGTLVRFVEERGAWVRIQEGHRTAWLHKKAVAPLWSDATALPKS